MVFSKGNYLRYVEDKDYEKMKQKRGCPGEAQFMQMGPES
jgi:hypothetical protein